MPTTGRYENSDGGPVVRFERTFPHPVAAVWEAVTDPAQLAQWFPTTVEFDRLSPGAAIAFAFAQDAYPPMSGEVLEVQGRARRREKAARDAAGWDQCLDMLALVAAGRAPPRPARSDQWRAYYEEYKRLGLPAEAAIPE